MIAAIPSKLSDHFSHLNWLIQFSYLSRKFCNARKSEGNEFLNYPKFVKILQTRSRDMWKEMVQLQTITSSIAATAISRKKRQFVTKKEEELSAPTAGSCCTCQVGPPGPPGPPGRDGRPGSVAHLFSLISKLYQRSCSLFFKSRLFFFQWYFSFRRLIFTIDYRLAFDFL